MFCAPERVVGICDQGVSRSSSRTGVYTSFWVALTMAEAHLEEIRVMIGGSDEVGGERDRRVCL